jgi:hypothetical protein
LFSDVIFNRLGHERSSVRDDSAMRGRGDAHRTAGQRRTELEPKIGLAADVT